MAVSGAVTCSYFATAALKAFAAGTFACGGTIVRMVHVCAG
jgi:hypothetical protein